MRKLIAITAVCISLLNCGTSNKTQNKQPPMQEQTCIDTGNDSAPVIANLTVTPKDTRIVTDNPLCTKATNLEFHFDYSAQNDLSYVINLEYIDTPFRIGGLLVAGDFNREAVEPMEIISSQDILNNPSGNMKDLNGRFDCSDAPRTYNYKFTVIDCLGRVSNTISAAWTVYP